ncbi:MAG: ABC transporter substrate-binding protein, partial [Nitrospinota bacterium]
LRRGPRAPWAGRVREALRRLVRRDLSEGELMRAAQRFGRGEAGALARWELARRAKAAGRVKEARERLQDFIKDFPQHERAWQARAALRELKEELVADPRKIGVLLPLSGPGAEAGKRLRQGIELALRAAAGIVERLGLRLVVRDTQGAPGKPGRAAEAAEGLAGRGKVIALLGPFFSSPTRAATAVADRHRVPLLTPFAIDGDIPQTSPWAFRNSLTNRQQAAAVAGYATERLGLRRFAILYPNERQGVELRDHFRQRVEAGGGRVLAQAAYPVGASDFGRQIRQLGGMDDDEVKRKKERLPPPAPGEPPARIPQIPYEAVFIPGDSEPAALIAPQLLFYNITGVRLLGARGWNSAKVVQYGEKYVEGAIFVDGFFAQSPLPRVRRFVEEFGRAFGSKPDIISALAYDSLGMLLQVLSRGARTRSEVRDGLLRLQNFPGVTGRTSMGADGDAQKELFILTVQKGRIVQLDTEAPVSALRVRGSGPS